MLQNMEIQDSLEITSTTTLDLLDPSEELLSKGGSAPLEPGDSEEEEVKVIGSKVPPQLPSLPQSSLMMVSCPWKSSRGGR